jgi:DNA adenine methylase
MSTSAIVRARGRLRAPFPYFGSKYDIALAIWERLGEPANYVEAFAGSLACLLSRPVPGKVETVNDYSGLVTNFWRAVKDSPEEVARYADNPVHELDLHAWHRLLVEMADGLRASLEGDPRFSDAELAGRWAWGASAWLGSGWCDGTTPRRRPELSGGSGRARNGHGVHGSGLTHQKRPAIGGQGSRPHGGVGVHRELHRTRPHLSNGGVGVNATALPFLSGGAETGVGYGRGVHSRSGRQFDGLVEWMCALADRLRFVRVCCGDFMRVLTPSVTTSHGITGVVLDPPYDREMRSRRIYEHEDDSAAPRARAWAIENGQNPLFRIALCGLADEHEMPDDWVEYSWSSAGGYGNQARGRGRENASLERIWFSPHCLTSAADLQCDLFGGA